MSSFLVLVASIVIGWFTARWAKSRTPPKRRPKLRGVIAGICALLVMSAIVSADNPSDTSPAASAANTASTDRADSPEPDLETLIAQLDPTIDKVVRNPYRDPTYVGISVLEKSAWSEATMANAFAVDAMRILRKGIKKGVLSPKDTHKFSFRTVTTDDEKIYVLSSELSPDRLAMLDLRAFHTSAGRFFDVSEVQGINAAGGGILRSFCKKRADDAPITCRRVASVPHW